jgi:hypothetical protein
MKMGLQKRLEIDIIVQGGQMKLTFFIRNNTYFVIVMGVIVIVALIGFLSFSPESAKNQPRQINYQALFADSLFHPIVDFSNKIYDDRKSSAYIVADNIMREVDARDMYNLGMQGGETKETIIELMVKKDWWSRQFPKKHIVSISIVPASHSCNDVAGLLIQYEFVQ